MSYRAVLELAKNKRTLTLVLFDGCRDKNVDPDLAEQARASDFHKPCQSYDGLEGAAYIFFSVSAGQLAVEEKAEGEQRFYCKVTKNFLNYIDRALGNQKYSFTDFFYEWDQDKFQPFGCLNLGTIGKLDIFSPNEVQRM